MLPCIIEIHRYIYRIPRWQQCQCLWRPLVCSHWVQFCPVLQRCAGVARVAVNSVLFLRVRVGHFNQGQYGAHHFPIHLPSWMVSHEEMTRTNEVARVSNLDFFQDQAMASRHYSCHTTAWRWRRSNDGILGQQIRSKAKLSLCVNCEITTRTIGIKKLLTYTQWPVQ